MKYVLMMSYLLSILFSSCTRVKKSVIFEKENNNIKFKIEECVRLTYVSNYIFYKIIVGNSKGFEINSLETDHGFPYSETVYKTAPICYLDSAIKYCVIENPEKLFEENSAYLNTENYTDSERIEIKKYMREDIYKNLKSKRERFVIYLSPKDYSREEFISISKSVLENIKTINTLLFECKKFNGYRNAYDGWQLSTLIYGNEDDFSEVYTKSKDDFFKIAPDGRIWHYNELALPNKDWLSGQDFIESDLIMPGKKIKLKSYSENDLKPYKNSKGESMNTNFFILASDSTSRK